ncbi:hypothetical protein Tdes44962_MAKER02336 [Teratosphaeria destructans]|uniref:DUF7730 domain-containing protein n=1 Tax=Teratosphaeria destructans TaxID=418781 RepID=A0A9W7W381_9PEZI|nr:hypothetical protein Tdes44962_MAKER02336 [Teratosphaeria destructans]
MDKSPFQKLPAERRNIIYEMVLQTPTDIALHAQIDTHIDSDMLATRQMTAQVNTEAARAARHCLELTRACKEIRSDTIALFYAINRFKFDPRLDIRVGQWGKASKRHYAEALQAVRRWLESISPAVRQNLKLHIHFAHVDASGSRGNLRPHRAVLWWKETRKLESSVLHSVMDPVNIYAVFEVTRCPFLECPACTTHPRPALTPLLANECQWAVLMIKRLFLVIPTANKNAAREEMEIAFRKHTAEVEQWIAAHPCGHDREVRERLQQSLDTVRMLVSDRS